VSDPPRPTLPEEKLAAGGWERVEETTETLFELPGIRVRGRTCRYEDERTRRALRAATDGRVDHPIRFFAATRLSFDPPLPPGVSPALVAPTLRSEARRTFARRLRDRGLADVERRRSERLRVADGTRARLRKYAATDCPAGEASDLPLECWLAVWTTADAALVVTGGYPAVTLADRFGVAGEALARVPGAYREEFFSLLRGVGPA